MNKGSGQARTAVDKLNAVHRSEQVGVRQVAADMGVHPATIYRWRAAVRRNPADPFPDQTARQAQARAEARLAQENHLRQTLAEDWLAGRLPYELLERGPKRFPVPLRHLSQQRPT